MHGRNPNKYHTKHEHPKPQPANGGNSKGTSQQTEETAREQANKWRKQQGGANGGNNEGTSQQTERRAQFAATSKQQKRPELPTPPQKKIQLIRQTTSGTPFVQNGPYKLFSEFVMFFLKNMKNHENIEF